MKPGLIGLSRESVATLQIRIWVTLAGAWGKLAAIMREQASDENLYSPPPGKG